MLMKMSKIPLMFPQQHFKTLYRKVRKVCDQKQARWRIV